MQLQLLIWFNLALVFPPIGIPGLFEVRTVDVMTPFVAALLGLGISRAPTRPRSCVPACSPSTVGQYEAAKSIGMTG